MDDVATSSKLDLGVRGELGDEGFGCRGGAVSQAGLVNKHEKLKIGRVLDAGMFVMRFNLYFVHA